MTMTTNNDKPVNEARELRRELIDDQLLDAMLASTSERGISLTGEGGFLPELIESVLERGMSAELTSHLGYEKNDPAGRGSGNSRNGTRSTTGSPTTSAPSGLRCPGTAMAPLRRGWSRNANDDLATWMPRC